MNEMHRPRRVVRSIGAVFAGFLAVVILSVGTGTVLHLTGVFPALGQPLSDALLLLATIYRTVYGVVGSYITARLAPARPMGHALAVGVVGLVLSTVGAVVTWNKGPAFGPHWYPLALIALAMPTAWAGGRLHGMPLRARAVDRITAIYRAHPQGFVQGAGGAPEQELRRIGEMLHQEGGMDLMLTVHAEFTNRCAIHGAPRNLEFMWDGIGNWRG